MAVHPVSRRRRKFKGPPVSEQFQLVVDSHDQVKCAIDISQAPQQEAPQTTGSLDLPIHSPALRLQGTGCRRCSIGFPEETFPGHQRSYQRLQIRSFHTGIHGRRYRLLPPDAT
jgi:hypothetical protein